MARTIVPSALARYISQEKKQLLEAAPVESRSLLSALYDQSQISAHDLSRKYSDAEVEMLCRRTKCRVKMYVRNCVHDAKLRLSAKNRLANKSERFVNAMLLKCVRRGMVTPYTDAEVASWRTVHRCITKEQNNLRLDRWQGTKSAVGSLEDLSQDANAEADTHTEKSAAVEASKQDPEDIDEEDLDFILDDLEANLSSDQELNSQGDEPEELTGNTQGDEPDWIRAGMQVNSESLEVDQGLRSQPSLMSQLSQEDDSPLFQEDYLRFDTQVVAASTQDTNPPATQL
ncbi:hypothetical protein KR018_005348 [Drosophila ironensis]|nr:hypothetical protein KR018_005348 [Drosophila ironensis]